MCSEGVQVSDLGPPTELIGVLVRVRKALVESPIPFEAGDAATGRELRASLLKQLDDYVMPRLVQIEAPLLCVVGGSTGAGKSTLVNSLVGHRVTEPGVLRPTTRSPVLVHNPEDAHWFGTDRLLPELRRTDYTTHDQSTLQLVPTHDLPPGVAILDAPDVDSVEERNRELAAQLLAAADLWLFVTSAARYADQVPWDFLKEAADRSTAVAVVLDRTTPKAVREVASHLARMLTARGLGDSPLFTVPECPIDERGLLPPEAVVAIRNWLESLAADSAARHVVVRKTLDGAVKSLGHRVRSVSSVMITQEQLGAQLRADAVKAYDDALKGVEEACADGTLLRGEVLARWQEFVGTGELMKSIEDRVGRIRDRLVSAATGRPQPAQQLTVAVESGLQTLIAEHAESAAERAALAWRSLPAGPELLDDSTADLSRASRDFRARTEKTVREWQAGVLDLVRTEGSDRRATARFLAYGVNGLGVALMIVVFSHSAGLTGAEVGVAGGTAVVGQRILEAVFGDQAVRRLVDAARNDLHRRVAKDLWEPELRRYLELLDAKAVPLGSADQLLVLSREIDDAQWLGARRMTVVETLRRLTGRSSDVVERVAGLDQAVQAARGRLDDELVDEAGAVVERATNRLRMSSEHTVVALAGATGSGKSSLFNSITGLDLAAVGVKRPTTSWALACAWGPDGATELLDWIGIPKRHQVNRMGMLDMTASDRDLQGLVLLDLPDHDSTEVSHHLEVERLVKLADVLVWVLDPQKYADAAIHDRFLKPLQTHADVMLVVLNHIDEVSAAEVDGMLADTRRLLALDGLVDVPVIGTSATTGAGLDELHEALTSRVADKQFAKERLTADVKAVAGRLAEQTGDAKPSNLRDSGRAELLEACADAAGVPVVVDAIEQASLQRARIATGWPVLSWVGRLRRDPMSKLKLGGSSDRDVLSASGARTSRTAMPETSSVQRARVDAAVRATAEAVTEGMAKPWETAVRSAAVARQSEVVDRLDAAVAGTDLGVSRNPTWWGVTRAVQWLLLLAALVGAGWLVALGVFSYVRSPEPEQPEVAGVSVPLLLLVGGVALGVAIAFLCRAAVRVSARRRAQVADERLRAAIDEVADELVIAPMQAQVDAYVACRDGVAAALRWLIAAGSGPPQSPTSTTDRRRRLSEISTDRLVPRGLHEAAPYPGRERIGFGDRWGSNGPQGDDHDRHSAPHHRPRRDRRGLPADRSRHRPQHVPSGVDTTAMGQEPAPVRRRRDQLDHGPVLARPRPARARLDATG